MYKFNFQTIDRADAIQNFLENYIKFVALIRDSFHDIRRINLHYLQHHSVWYLVSR